MAASNIDGQTLHSAFKLDFSHDYKSLSDKKRDELRNHFKNVQVVIIDEFSMMKNFQLYQLHMRLCDLKQSDQIMGGVAVLMFGDLMQLRPVRGNFIFEPPKYGKLKDVYSAFNLWETFECIMLEKNHRQGSDKTYAEILNRLRFKEKDEELTEEDTNILKARIKKPSNEEQTVKIFGKNETVNKINEERLQSLKSTQFTLEAIHQPMRKNLKITAAGTIEDTAFQQTLHLKVGARVMLIHNVNTLDGLTNGAQGKVMDIVMKNEKVRYIIVRFDNPDIGAEQRRSHRFISSVTRSEELTPIPRFELSYTLGDVRKDHGARASFLQFPLKLSWALTAHKCQGQSIFPPNSMFTDLHTFEAAMAYVILSRITSLDQLYLQELDPKQIYCNKMAKEEVTKLKSRAINLQSSSWTESQEEVVKICSLNTRSFNQHSQEIKEDEFIMQSDIILIQETWLKSDLEDNIPNYHHYYVHGYSKGIAVLSRHLPIQHSSSQTSLCSFLKLSFRHFDIINIYRFSENSNLLKFTTEIIPLLDRARTQVVAGDFNIDLNKTPNNCFTTSLLDMEFKQLINRSTHNKGGLIDHVYFHPAGGTSCALFSHHTMFWSDHDCLAFLVNTKQHSDASTS